MYPQTTMKPIDYVAAPSQKVLPKYNEHPEFYRLGPFRIFGNLYYVGDRKVCPQLVDTGEGLILFDTGYGPETHLLMENIRTLGFRLEDIKIIIHTHGHFDHFGGTDQIKAISGAKVYMSRVDTQLLREKPDRSLISWGYDPSMPIPWPDVEIEDGDHIRLGNTDILCRLAPGHTPGTMCFFFDVTDGEKNYRVGYWGGVGLNQMKKEFCQKYDLPQGAFYTMLTTIEKLWNEPVDITLGNHPPQNATLQKRQWMLQNPGSNPFIDPTTWQIQLATLKENCEKAIALGY